MAIRFRQLWSLAVGTLMSLAMIAGMIAGAAQSARSAESLAGTASKQGWMLSDPLNDRLPKWLHFGGEYRARVEGFTSGGFKPNNDDAYFLSRLRLSLTVQPESWLKFSFQGQDAHVFWKNQNPPAPPFQDAMDLRVGYMELGDLEKMRAGVRVGRQEMVFGDERLIGTANWLNTPRIFYGGVVPD